VTALVLGVGLVGSHIIRELLARGEAPVGLDRGPSPENLHGIRGRFELVEADLLNVAALVDVMRSRPIDRIIHTVALVGPAAEAYPYEGFRVNVIGAVNALEAARLCGIRRFVFYSSMAIFHPDDASGPLDEEASKKPAGMNGAAKLCVENVGEIYASAHGIEFVSLRIGGVYGAGHSSGGVPQQLRACAEALLRGEPYAFEKYVYTGRTDVIEARDAAAAGILAADLAWTPRHLTYNVGNGEAFTYEELAAAVRAAMPGARVDVRETSRIPVRTTERTMDVGRARAELGFRAEYPFARGFPLFVDWVRAAQPA
jgi:nucleoside-diphosphate-sugar epimerase